MEKLITFSLFYFVVWFIAGCTHNIAEELLEDQDTIGNNMVLYEGSFTSHNNYSVTGQIRLVETDSSKQLFFESFSCSSGPDLKVYISESVLVGSHLDIGNLKALSGNFSYTLPDNFATANHGTYVLVYCERFSRLFGSANLTMVN